MYFSYHNKTKHCYTYYILYRYTSSSYYPSTPGLKIIYFFFVFRFASVDIMIYYNIIFFNTITMIDFMIFHFLIL